MIKILEGLKMATDEMRNLEINLKMSIETFNLIMKYGVIVYKDGHEIEFEPNEIAFDFYRGVIMCCNIFDRVINGKLVCNIALKMADIDVTWRARK